jgi:glycine hydroxymethyltransferase
MQTSGVRLGTAALTSRGANEAHMHLIADLIAEVAEHLQDRKVLARIRRMTEDIAGDLEPV